MIRHYFRKLGKSERGATMVEFAIIALLLFTLILGIVEFGWLFFGWITLTGAVREGARRAIVGEADVVQVVENHARAVSITSGPTISRGGAGHTRTVTVAATGEIPLLTGLFSFLSNTGGNSYRVSAEATMRYESGMVTVTNNEQDVID